MELDFDGSYVLYGLGILLGIFSVFYFGFEILLNLSPVTKAMLLLLVSASFILAGLRFSGRFLSIPFHALGAFSYIIFIAYTLARFNFSKEVDFVILAVSSAAFLGLGYRLRQSGLGVDQERLVKGLGAAAFIAVALSAVDVVGPLPTHQLELRDEVNLSDREVTIGTLHVENSFFLHRGTDLPWYEACVDGDQRLFVDRKNVGLMPGGSSKNVNLTLTAPEVAEDEPAIKGVYRVRKVDSCPENPERGTLYVFEDKQRYD